jgi:hypothetical protein
MCPFFTAVKNGELGLLQHARIGLALVCFILMVSNNVCLAIDVLGWCTNDVHCVIMQAKYSFFQFPLFEP